MTEKFHRVKTWDSKDYSKIKVKDYISIKALQDWIDEQPVLKNGQKWIEQKKLEQFIKP